MEAGRDLVGTDEAEAKRRKFGEEPEAVLPDSLYAVYVIFLVLGVGIQLPWNMFLTASEYFRDERLVAHAAGAPAENAEVPDYRENFAEYISITGVLPKLLFSLLNIALRHRGQVYQSPKRFVAAMAFRIALHLLTTFLVLVDTSTWIPEFFALTIASMALINAATGIYQTYLFGMASALPMQYTNAVLIGVNSSGVFTAALQLVVKAAAGGGNNAAAALAYFGTSTALLLLSLGLYFALYILPFYKLHKEQNEQRSETVAAIVAPSSEILARCSGVQGVDTRKGFRQVHYGEILKQIYVQLVNVWTTHFVTYSSFPALLFKIERSSDSFFIPEEYFTPVTCFLFFSTFTLVGNTAANWIRVPSARWLWLPCLARTAFVPTFYFCNYAPAVRSAPVLVSSDSAYLVLVIVFSLSAGYCSSLSVMYTPRAASKKYANVAAQIANATLLLGVVSGIAFSRLLSWVVHA